MLKHFAIVAALAALGMGSAAAQQREAVLHKIEVANAGFDLVIASARPDGWTFDPEQHSWAHVVYIGDRLAHPITDEMVKLTSGVGALTLPACSFETEGWRGSRSPVALYVVPKGGSPLAAASQ